jgi:hypothetical protein
LLSDFKNVSGEVLSTWGRFFKLERAPREPFAATIFGPLSRALATVAIYYSANPRARLCDGKISAAERSEVLEQKAHATLALDVGTSYFGL